MTFTTTKLANNRVLVEGSDVRGFEGELEVDGTEWADLTAHQTHADAHEKFEEVAREHLNEVFGPLFEAMGELRKDGQPEVDPTFHVVVQEGVKGVVGQAEVVHELTKDSVILRLIEENADTERLIWNKAGDDLRILAAPAVAAVATIEPTAEDLGAALKVVGLK